MGGYESDYIKAKNLRRAREHALFEQRIRKAEPAATEKQIKFMKNIIRKRGWDDAHTLAELQNMVRASLDRTSVTHPEHLTKTEASSFIAKWKTND